MSGKVILHPHGPGVACGGDCIRMKVRDGETVHIGHHHEPDRPGFTGSLADLSELSEPDGSPEMFYPPRLRHTNEPDGQDEPVAPIEVHHCHSRMLASHYRDARTTPPLSPFAAIMANLPPVPVTDILLYCDGCGHYSSDTVPGHWDLSDLDPEFASR